MEFKKIMMVVLIVSILLISSISHINAKKNEIIIAEANWPGIRAKTAAAKILLTKIGYPVSTKFVNDVVAHNGVAEDQIDIYMGSWMPTRKDTMEKIKDKVEIAATNTDNCLYIMGVPKYVWDQGVKTFADLEKYKDKFDKKMYVGPSGWAADKIMQKAIDNNVYNLGDWEVVNSTQGATLAQVTKSIREKEWICFVAWKPHWMNYMFDIKYLKDPEKLWEDPISTVLTLVPKNFKSKWPEAHKLTKNLIFDIEVLNKWIYEIGKNNTDPEKTVLKWMKNNKKQVEKWLDGVKAKNGEDAYKVFLQNI
ncbi:MAG: glycine/betaine ABC transporter substrate-binding protein [Candidatus Mcinerneyibacterium aminivorans]|uniref:Glycine/betaine ABC transporter substrate-binding protein n=1 Tax=Candidatus Mcinerneyibacterium aminivorans TaxID=2703815 RepID=A0A5D0MGB1_9BACT|nr:MAG: glycine/betaine ABC transporter substrate-binding protein [Candidatus Mcinerneyibacterium aminivorans]